MYTWAMMTAMNLFRCHDLDDSYVNYKDNQLECSVSDPDFYAALVPAGSCLLIWGIAIPVILLRVMIKAKRHKPETFEKIKSYCVYAMIGYKQDRLVEFWEFIILARKFALICIVVLFQ
jgi:hypothetical protein